LETVLSSLVLALLPRLADDSSNGGFVAPSVDELFPDAVLFIGTPFALNRILLIRLLAVVIICLILWLASRRMRVVPGKGQVLFELVFDFIRKGVVIDTLGEKDGKRFMPVILTIFFATLAMNLTGTIPGLQISSTALIGQALLMAILAYVLFVYAGIKKFGVGHFFKNALWLPGVPVFLRPIIAILEVLSTFIVRPVTLTLRLTMNMLAGHMLLALCFLATHFFFLTVLADGNFLGLLGFGTLAMGVAFTVLELFVGVLQAYIFAILTAIYIQLALAEEH